MKCECNGPLIWGSDIDQDIEGEDNYIVRSYTCPSDECNIETVIVYIKILRRFLRLSFLIKNFV